MNQMTSRNNYYFQIRSTFLGLQLTLNPLEILELSTKPIKPRMLTEAQLSSIVNAHIYLFKDDIQANAHHHLFNSSPQNQPYSQPKRSKHETQQKPQMKIDIWKVNKTISHHQDYIGPIISFQRREIWAKNHQHNNEAQTTEHRSNSKPKHQDYSQQPNFELTDLSITVPNPTTNHKRNPYQSRHSSLQKHSNTPQHHSLFSTVKPYPFKEYHFNQNPIFVPQSNFKNQAISYEQKPNKQPRRNNFFNHQSEGNSQIKNSEIKRRHKIFSLSSKVSKQKTQERDYSEAKRKIEEEKSIQNQYLKHKIAIKDQVSTLPQQSKQQTPKHTSFQQTIQIPQVQQKNDQQKVSSIKVQNSQNQLVQEHVKFDLKINEAQSQQHKIMGEDRKQEKKSSVISIVNHFATIQNSKTKEKVKNRANSQMKTLIETDYVPSPSELSTILKTIEKQSREVKDTRNTIQNRKSVYLKKLNQSIRYHEENFNQNQMNQGLNNEKQELGKTKSQIVSQPSLIYNLQNQINHQTDEIINNKGYKSRNQQFVPMDPRLFEHHLVSLDNPAKVKFNYLDPKTSKYQF